MRPFPDRQKFAGPKIPQIFVFLRAPPAQLAILADAHAQPAGRLFGIVASRTRTYRRFRPAPDTKSRLPRSRARTAGTGVTMADSPPNTNTLRRSVFGVSTALGTDSGLALMGRLIFPVGLIGGLFVPAGGVLLVAFAVGCGGLTLELFDGDVDSFCSTIDSFSFWPGLGASD